MYEGYEMIDTIQYVYDGDGHKTAVIVPIDLWEKAGITIIEGKTCDISHFYGAYRDCMPNPDTIARSMRDEWDRK